MANPYLTLIYGPTPPNFEIAEASEVDDVLDTKLERQFQLITDKGTLDAIRLHPEGPVRRMLYWESVSKLLAPDGILVITSCNSTKDELVQEAESFIQRSITLPSSIEELSTGPLIPTFRYLDHVRTYPTFTFGGLEGSRVASVAFIRRSETR